MKIYVRCLLCTILVLVCIFAAACSVGMAEQKTFKNYNEVIKYVKDEQPKDLKLEDVKFTIPQLIEIKNNMPEGAHLSFNTKIGQAEISDQDTEIDLNKATGKLTAADLEGLIKLVPGVKKINVLKHRELGKEKMIPLVDKYPEIEFIWLIKLGERYTLSSAATVFSTMNSAYESKGLTSEQLAPIRYAKHLKALDIGHNRVDDLSVLKELPELRLLILADNQIKDLSPITACPNLQYLEIFSCGIEDISPLENCKELIDLNISNNKISDLKPLDKCDKLERLWASQNPISPEEMQRFTEKHPGCEAMFTNQHPTSDGWRYHWRYKQYTDMFRKHEWREFVPPVKET